MKMISFFIVLMALIGTAQSYNVKDYGALAVGKTISILAIQKAIDDCSTKGGGMVYIPAGEFLNRTISLKNNLDFHLAMSAVLKGSSPISLTNGQGFATDVAGKAVLIANVK